MYINPYYPYGYAYAPQYAQSAYQPAQPQQPYYQNPPQPQPAPQPTTTTQATKPKAPKAKIQSKILSSTNSVVIMMLKFILIQVLLTKFS